MSQLVYAVTNRVLLNLAVLKPVSAGLTCAVLLFACGGNYQAPVSEQGRPLDVSAPEILSSRSSARRDIDLSQPSTERRIEVSRPEIVSSAPQDYASGIVESAPRAVASKPVSAENTSASGNSRSILSRAGSAVSNVVGSAINGAGAIVSGTGSVASNAATSGAGLAGSHLVQAGDTLFSIAFQYDLDFRSLALANGLQPPYTIFVGQELNLALDTANAAASVINRIGSPVPESGAARSRATSGNSGGVLRQPIGGSTAVNQPSWNWPHQGTLARRYAAGASKGIDIAGNIGDPVLAAGAGDVVYSGRGVQGSGNLIIIRHSDRYLSAYAHNSAMLVPEGYRVQAGEQIGEVGVNPAGVPMLHFEIRRDGQAIDPLEYLPARP